MQIHYYAVNDLLNASERSTALYRLAFFASIVGGGLSLILGWLTSQWALLTAVSAPSTVIIYLWFLNWIERWLWKWKLVRLSLGIATPDINGKWTARGTGRNRDGKPIGNDSGKLIIQQTWNTIGISYETDIIESHSTSASLVQQAGRTIVSYEYRACPINPAEDAEAEHTGTGAITFDSNEGEVDLNSARIKYYTNHRETGMIELSSIC